MKAAYCRYILKFCQPATTSREVMLEKETYFIKLWDEKVPSCYGIGECALFRGLSADDFPDYEDKLFSLCHRINTSQDFDLPEYSSIRFGYETAFKDYQNGGNRIIFPSAWTAGMDEISINGLVWMGDFDEMYNRINEKLKSGFRCVKLKVGGIDFAREVQLIEYIRGCFSVEQLELRLDANGAFSTENVMERLSLLSKYSIHSIEQPIKAEQWDNMRIVCKDSPIPIALDEELIGVSTTERKIRLLEYIKPQYIILKPALCGGISEAKEWIDLAESLGIGWWVTSALESNIGLNAIAQWVATLGVEMPQGLGTGQLYLNNIQSPLNQQRDVLQYNLEKTWGIPKLNWVEP